MAFSTHKHSLWYISLIFTAKPFRELNMVMSRSPACVVSLATDCTVVGALHCSESLLANCVKPSLAHLQALYL